ncbi:MAG: DNA-directed RNA polymerase subunit omega [Saprospiraceae bacterium]|nr:DNA-directed RNA polymerase subunit omega [Saprospiraceae bacterium]
MDIKTKVQNLDANVQARNIGELVGETDNIYTTIAIIAKRAKQLSVDIKHELHQKLEEFAISSDAIEEVHENKEQIEISKFYERLPNSAMIATEEFLNGEIAYRFREDRPVREEE